MEQRHTSNTFRKKEWTFLFHSGCDIRSQRGHSVHFYLIVKLKRTGLTNRLTRSHSGSLRHLPSCAAFLSPSWKCCIRHQQVLGGPNMELGYGCFSQQQ